MTMLNYDRRHFLRNAAMSFAAVELATIVSVTPTAQSTRPARRIATGSQENTITASSRAASATIFRRRLRRLLPRPSST